MLQANALGPQITPKSPFGGGDARPPFLQARRPVGGPVKPSYSGQQTQPIVTPKSSVMPGEVKSPPAAPQPGLGMPQVSSPGSKPPQAGGQTLADVYKFFQSDLENQKNQALAGSRSDAAARGVFYGTPLTGSEADINTQYLRGLGQLQAGMYGNEQQNELSRLSLAGQMMGPTPQPQQPGQMDLSAIGSIFGASPAVAGQRTGPAVTPKQKPLEREDIRK